MWENNRTKNYVLKFPSKKCERCNKYFLPRSSSHTLCHSCYNDKIGASPQTIYASKLLEIKQKIGNNSHLTINCCEKCQLPFLVSVYESKRKKFCTDCIGIKDKERAARKHVKQREDLINSRGNKCERCPCADTDAMEIHHRDRDRTNNTEENLEVICANCHTIEHKKIQ
jgi:hypothetical protein